MDPLIPTADQSPLVAKDQVLLTGMTDREDDEGLDDRDGLDLETLVAEGNGTSSVDGSSSSSHFHQVEQLTFLWILFGFIVVGNATVLVALTLSKGRKSRMNFFIKNLAAADLMVGLISVLTDIIWKITISWEAGLVACKLIRFLQAVVTYASTYVLVALSIDRYDAISHPMNFSGSWKRARALVAAAWLLSLVFSAPILHFYNTQETAKYGTQCWINFSQPWQWQVYMTLVSLTVFVVPAVLIAGCYIVIVSTIWNKGKDLSVKSRIPAADGGADGAGKAGAAVVTAGGRLIRIDRLRSNRRDASSEAAAEAAEEGPPRRGDREESESRRASSRGLIPKAKVKTVKMTFVIIFVFILCWSPYILFDLLQVFGCIPSTRLTRAAATFIQSLAPLNSAANPLIYCMFSTNIGQQLCNLLGCGSKRSTPLSTGLTTTNTNTTSTHANATNQSRSEVPLLTTTSGCSLNGSRKARAANNVRGKLRPKSP